MNSDIARQQAEKVFKQDGREQGRRSAMTAYETRSRDVGEKIKRLRALRLAKQALEPGPTREK